jgi:hypothetical protein
MKTIAVWVGVFFLNFMNNVRADAVILTLEKPLQLPGGAEIGILRKGEGEHWLYLELGKQKRICLWKSFWGKFSVIADEKSNAIAFRDGHRFGVLSPVIAVRYSPDGASFAYQTPGNFSLESTEFTYDLKSFQANKLQVSLSLHDFTKTGSSRPEVKEVSVFTVLIDMKKTIIPRFFDESDTLFMEKPFVIK